MISKSHSADACAPLTACHRNQGFGTGLGRQFVRLVWRSLFAESKLGNRGTSWDNTRATETLPTWFDLCFLGPCVSCVSCVCILLPWRCWGPFMFWSWNIMEYSWKRKASQATRPSQMYTFWRWAWLSQTTPTAWLLKSCKINWADNL